MGKKAKEHRKKIAKRNEAIKSQQKKLEKAKEEILKKLVEKERMEGKFNNEMSPLPGINGPTLGDFNGPRI